MPFVIITVGKTHSGKTTFGKELAKKLKDKCILLDSDVLTDFLKDNFPGLYQGDWVKKTNKLLSPGYYLKRVVLLEIYKQALKTNLLIISTSSNSKEVLRHQTRSLAERAGRKFIIIYFNLPEKVLLNRIKHSNRSKNCLIYSKNFTDLLVNRQTKHFEAPKAKEADFFFEINNDKSRKNVKLKILKLLRQK